MFQDVRFGLRMLAKSPGFTAVAALSLALGIGANTAIFTLIDAVLLKMLPVKKAQELVLFQWWSKPNQLEALRFLSGNTWEEGGRDFGTSFSYPTFQQIRAQGTGEGRPLADVLAFANIGNMNVVANGEAGLAFAQMVSHNYFSELGVRAAVGRMLAESDDRSGAIPVCVISDRYWNRRFGGDRSIAGKSITIDKTPFTIVGVTQPDFFGLQPGLAIDISVPLALQRVMTPAWDPQASFFTAADHWWLVMMGRLQPGASARRAGAALNVLFKQGNGDALSAATLELAPGSQGLDQLRRRYSRPLWILMGMVGLVLLIACANVANLLLARATFRQKEISVRLSMGAPRVRLIRQLLTESLLLASMSGALGLVLAWWGSRMLVTLLSTPEHPIPLDLSPDLRILGFCAAACLMTGVMFGLAPALRTTRVDLTPSLKRAGGRVGLGKMLMVAQTALSLVLLFGAGLFVRTLVNLEKLDAGFDKEKLLLFGVNASRAGYQGAALNDFYNRVQQRVASLPGVVSATASVHALLSGSRRNNGLWVPGYTPQPGQRMSVMVVPSGPEFFHTMKIPLLRGRDFSERDAGDAPKVAVVNEAFVKRYFADRGPMGQRIAWDRTKPEMEIVGVARDAKYFSLRDESPATVYHPYRQETNTGWMHYEVRTAGDPHALIPEVQRALGALDRNVPVFEMKTQTEQIDELLDQERLFAKLSGFFGLLALVLVCVGLYGVLSYAVARRTSELGLRMALGAQRSDIVGMVARETLLVVLGGLAVGIPASMAAARLASSVISDLLYGLKAGDIPSVAIAAAALAVVAAVAGAVRPAVPRASTR